MRFPNVDTDSTLTQPSGRATDGFRTWLDGMQKWIRRNGGAIYGTSAERTTASTRGYIDPKNVADGTFYFETDTGLVYQWRAVSLDWFYASGTYSRTQAQLAALAAVLKTRDTGLLVNVTDYAHVLQWTGAAWAWGPREEGSGKLQPFAVAPTGNGWHVCDGSAGVTYLKSDGTTGTVTLPNTAATAAHMKLGAAYASAITAATVPTISAPTFTGTAGTTATGNAVIGFPTTVTGFTAGGTTAPGADHKHNDAGHSHGFTPQGTVSQPIATLPADPVANFQALFYFRQ